MLKRIECCGDRYNKVCLVLDDDVANQICTNSNHGFKSQSFDNLRSDYITWKLPLKG